MTQLLTFSGESVAKVTFYIPTIHCSSCLWLLEHLYRINPAIGQSRVDFLKKQVHLTYNPAQLTLRQAKRNATDELARCLDFLPQSRPGQSRPGQSRPGHLHSEILPGDVKLMLTIYLLLRRYDYLLIEFGQEEVLAAFMACQKQVATKLCSLNAPRHLLCRTDLSEESEFPLRIGSVNR